MHRYRLPLVTLGIGIVAALLLRAFELIVNNGTDWLWNDLFRSDTHRWVLIPLTVGLSIALSLLIRRLGQARVTEPETDVLAHIGTGPATLSSIGVILAIGLASLLAGASLGPEAALLSATAAIGAWVANNAGLESTKRLLVLASIGALLVAFLGSMFLVLIPLLLLYKERMLNVMNAVVVVVAALSSFATLQFIDHEHPGYGQVPPLPAAAPHDLATAFAAGFSATIVALLLVRLVSSLSIVTKRIGLRLAWPYAAIAFGLGIGLLYLWGGESVQFSGSTGSTELLEYGAQYGAWALLTLVAAKLLATTWSKASGYRGGLVFPSIYLGIAFGLLASQLLGADPNTGAIVGGIGGMMHAATGSPIMAAILLIAVLPSKLMLVAVLAIVGSVAGNRLLSSFLSKPDTGP